MRQQLQRGRWILIFLAAMLAAPLGVKAQTTRGELAGNITDSSGAVIPGAQIVATEIDTGARNVTASTSSGSYRFAELAIGRYNVSVTAPGFATESSTGVLVTINSVTALNVVLKAGATTETVTVDASAPGIQSESSDIGGTISVKQMDDLPLAVDAGVGGLRSPESFEFLVPGTTGPGTGGGQSVGGLNNNGVFFAKIAGGQSYGAETMLDGASIIRSENGSSFDETSPSVEALQEFKVTTAAPSAEFGRSTAGFESFTTKSGTNVFHGTGFTIIKNAALDANQWFNNGDWKFYGCTGTRLTTTPNCVGYLRGQDSKFDYGGTFGGPVRIPNPFKRDKELYNGKDKTFFFFAWEQYKLRLGGVSEATVPTTTGGTSGKGEQGGDFSAILGPQTTQPTLNVNPCDGTPVLQDQIFDPTTQNTNITPTNPTGIPCAFAYPGNIVPSGDFSNGAKALMAGLPAPNQQPISNPPWGFYNNYAQSAVAPTYNTTYTVRIDESLAANHKIYGSYSSRDNFSVHGLANLPQPFNNSAYPQDFETHYTRVGYDYTITPSILNHLNVGYNRTNSKNFASSIGAGRTLTAAGVPNFYSTAFPIVNFDGFDSFSPWMIGQGGDNIDNGLRVNESVNWEKGRNSFKFGIDWRHQQYSVIDVNIPNLTFYRGETSVAAVGGNFLASGNSFASFLVGVPAVASQEVFNHNPRWNSHYYGFFVQDDLKINSSLTLNLGVRYDVDVPRHEAGNDTSNLSFSTPDAAAGGLPGALLFGTNCKCNSAWADTWYKDLAPRIGFAYVLPGSSGKMVLRGGGGIIYGPLQYDDFGASMNAGYNQSRNVGSPNNFTAAFPLDSGVSQWTQSFFAPNTDPTQLTTINGPGTFEDVGGQLILKKSGRPSMTTEWSLQLQQELAQDLIFTLGYEGESAQNLHSEDISNVNNIPISDFAYGDNLNNPAETIPQGGTTTFTAENGQTVTVKAPYSTFTGVVEQALRPYPQYGYIADDCCLENYGHSSYDAMVASLNRRFRQGVNLQVSYTWSKILTDADTEIAQYDRGAQSQNSSDFKGEKAISNQNIPQTLSISYLYQFPFGKGKMFLNRSGALDRIVGGWELGGIQRYESGQPLSFGCATGINALGNYTGVGGYDNCFRFTRNPSVSLSSAAYRRNKNGPNFFNGESWFNPAFRAPGTNGPTDPGVPLGQGSLVDQNREGPGWLRPFSAGCNGCSFAPYYFSGGSPNVPGGIGLPRVTGEVTGPLWKSEDFSLLKNIAINERSSFQFKLEAINAFNRHRFAIPDLSPGDSSQATGFGIPTGSDLLARTYQLTGRFNF
ncbi:MAG: TonB-dependent receptor [Terracidiphilus sp.]